MKSVREKRLAERTAAGMLEEGEREREEEQIAKLSASRSTMRSALSLTHCRQSGGQ